MIAPAPVRAENCRMSCNQYGQRNSDNRQKDFAHADQSPESIFVRAPPGSPLSWCPEFAVTAHCRRVLSADQGVINRDPDSLRKQGSHEGPGADRSGSATGSGWPQILRNLGLER
jgi:hypothetical protein